MRCLVLRWFSTPPVSLSGSSIDPNGIYPSNLLAGFSQGIQDVSIPYAPTEFRCGASATMGITGFRNSVLVTTSTSLLPLTGTVLRVV